MDTFFTRPEAKFQNYINAKHKRPFGNSPLKGFDRRAQTIQLSDVVWVSQNLCNPFVGTQPKRVVFIFQLFCKCCLACTG